jgi:flagellar hook-associated protein 3 FlgL
MARLAHFQRTIGTANSWLSQTENSMRELQYVMVNAYELLVKAATDGKTGTDKQNIAKEVGQLRNHFVDTLNTTFGSNFVFGGFNTPGDSEFNLNDTSIRPFVVENGNLMFNGFNLSQFDNLPARFLHDPASALLDPNQRATAIAQMNENLGRPDPDAVPPLPGLTDDEFDEAINRLHRLKSDVLTFDVGPGIEMPVTMNGIDMVLFTTMSDDNVPIIRSAFSVLTDFYEAIIDPDNSMPADELTNMIRPFQDAQNHILTKVAEVGGRTRRLELLSARYEQDQINNRQMLSDAEDVDMAEVIMELRMAEAVMQASMAAGARIIQPSLMDFLR